MGKIKQFIFYNEKEIFCEDTGETAIGYSNYLNTNHWNNTRKKLFDLKGHVCDFCGKDKPKMIVHHIRYSNLGHENIDMDLIPLCEECHKFIHRHIEKYPKYFDIDERKDIKYKQIRERKLEKRREYNKKKYEHPSCFDCFYRKRISINSKTKETKPYCKYTGSIIASGSIAQDCEHFTRYNKYKGKKGKKIDYWRRTSGKYPSR